MSFSRKAAFGYVPLMSRLVLAAAFIPAGWDKIMGEPVVYTGADAALLHPLGVNEAAGAPAGALSQTPVYQDGAHRGRLGDRIRPRPPTSAPGLASRPAPGDEPQPAQAEPEEEPQDEVVVGQPVDVEPVVAAEPEPEPAPKAQPQPSLDSAHAANKQPPAANEPPPVKARRLYRVAVTLVNDCPWPANLHPDWMAWVAAGTELIGGALILVGLFSRIWGAGLAITMAFAFYLTTLANVVDMGPLNLAPETFNRAFTQLGLFVMALGVTMTGAGRISFDRFFFPNGYEDEEHLLQLG